VTTRGRFPSRVLAVRAFAICRASSATLHMVEGPCLPCRARGRWREGPILCICDNCEGRGSTADPRRLVEVETDGVRLAESCNACGSRALGLPDLTFAIVDVARTTSPRIAYEGYLRATTAIEQLKSDPVLADRLFPPVNPTLFSTC
jgi:hypothetical protein